MKIHSGLCICCPVVNEESDKNKYFYNKVFVHSLTLKSDRFSILNKTLLSFFSSNKKE